MRILVLTALLAAAASWANAQKAAAPAHAAARHLAVPPASIQSLSAASDFASLRHSHHSSPFQSLLYPFGLFPDSSYPDNPPPVSGSPLGQSDLLLQALSVLTSGPALGTPQQPPSHDSHSLLIELQGDRYVSLTNGATGNEPEPTVISSLRKSSSPKSGLPKASSPKRPLRKDPSEKSALTGELMPVTLLFRDGHREDVRDYTIADGVIYARGDFYNDGYWNRKIELSALDLLETVKSNEAHGIRFVLPNSPNEVVTRP